MIRQKIKLKEYDWTIYAYYAVTTYYVDEIMEHLWDIGIDGNKAQRAYRSMSKGNLDTGLTYSNYARRESIIVVAKTSSADEFLNSMTHEAAHTCVHIALASFVDLKSEAFAYMVGDLCMEIGKKTKHLMCDCCRNKAE